MGEAEAGALEHPPPTPSPKARPTAHTVGYRHYRNREVASRAERECALAAGKAAAATEAE